MLKKIIEIDGKQVPFRASATVPRLYRAYFGRDIFKDLLKLKDSSEKIDDTSNDKQEFEINDLEMFENVAFIMAKHADSSIPNTAEEWLEQFNTFSIYKVLPQILELWKLNNETMVESKKKLEIVAGK